MKLVRHGERGAERSGLIDKNGVIRDLSAVIPDINRATIAPSQLEELRSLLVQALPAVPSGARLESGIERVIKRMR